MNSNNIVKKSNALITAKYELTKIEQKIIISIISMINKTDEDFHQYRFHIKDFFDLTDTNSKKNYTYIKNAFKGLLKKPIEIIEGEDHIICNWLSGAKINSSGSIDIEIYSGLKPYLLKLKEQFTKYKLKNILFLHSTYSIRIYELLKQFENTGIKQITIEEFKNILSLPKSYEVKHLKPYVLEPAKSELAEKTDIKFDYKFEKNGKRFNLIKFFIKSKENKENKKINMEDNVENKFINNNSNNINKFINNNSNNINNNNNHTVNNNTEDYSIADERKAREKRLAEECKEKYGCAVMKKGLYYCRVCTEFHK